MHRHVQRLGPTSLVTLTLALSLAACSDDEVTNVSPLNRFTETRLVADASAGAAAAVDTRLVNPWGLTFGPTGILWVANNQTGTSTLYDAAGVASATVVTVPSAGGSSGGAPTGMVFNSTSDFHILGGAAALFIFAGEDGTISAWNAANANARVVVDRSSTHAVYKGIAIASSGGANFIFATDFRHNAIDVFDNAFRFVKSFTDPNIPAGFAPFGIANVGGQLYVTYAKQLPPDNEDDQPGAGNGFVNIFAADGTLVRRFASNGSLNSPWAVVVAPAGFGPFEGEILIGNFGDGRISAFDATTGQFDDVLRDMDGNPIAIDGLWGLTFGPTAGSTTLYFAAGPDDEAHGLLGTLEHP